VPEKWRFGELSSSQQFDAINWHTDRIDFASTLRNLEVTLAGAQKTIVDLIAERAATACSECETKQWNESLHLLADAGQHLQDLKEYISPDLLFRTEAENDYLIEKKVCPNCKGEGRVLERKPILDRRLCMQIASVAFRWAFPIRSVTKNMCRFCTRAIRSFSTRMALPMPAIPSGRCSGWNGSMRYWVDVLKLHRIY
jgi:hypothetical protein